MTTATSPKKVVYFSATIDRYFAAWIKRSTWFKQHSCDMNRFYAFVYAIHRLSKLVDCKQGEGKWIRVQHEDGTESVERNGHRNPRTYRGGEFRDKIIWAVRRNQPGFSEEELQRVAKERTRTAMEILEFLWVTRDLQIPGDIPTDWPVPTLCIPSSWDPQLK